MAKPILDEQLWSLIEPIIPKRKRRFRYPGRKSVSDRAVLTGILFVLRTGIGWEYLPQEMGCGSGMTCWRRLRDWQAAGVWDKLHRSLLNRLREAGRIDWSRATVDSSSVRAVGGGRKTGPNPTDRRKPGSKHHIITDGSGVPLKAILTGANRHDVTQLIPLVDGVPAIAGVPGRPRRRPESIYADRAYDSEPHRNELRERGIDPFLAKRNTEHGSGLGVYRWVAERTISWLHNFRKLRIRFDRRDDIHEAFMTLGESIICHRLLTA
jgi:transposase